MDEPPPPSASPGAGSTSSSVMTTNKLTEEMADAFVMNMADDKTKLVSPVGGIIQTEIKQLLDKHIEGIGGKIFEHLTSSNVLT